MKTLPKALGTLVLVLFGAMASTSAMAQYRGHGHGHGHGGNVRFGISIGVPIFGPRFYPAPYYPYPAPIYTYRPLVVVPSAPQIYVEQAAVPASPAPSQPQGDWYYCAVSKAYYPYVAECAADWQRVPAQPPAH